MPESALGVKFTGDVTDLQAKSAIVKAELAADGTAVRALAKQYVAASEETKTAIAGQLQSAVAAYQTQKTELQALQAEMAKTAVETEVTAGVFAKFTEGMTAATERVEGISASLGAVSKLTMAFGELALAGLGLEKVADVVDEVAERGEKLERLSQITGLTIEQLSGLQVMASQTGTDFDAFTKVLDKLPGTMQEAAINPASKAGEAFHAMGISLTDLSTGQLLPLGDVLDQISAKLASYQDGANKDALETDIFGAKLGSELIPMLNQLGQVGLQGAIEKSNELSMTISGPQADADERFVQDMGRMKLGVEGMASSIVEFAIPALDAMAKSFSLATGTASIDDQISSVQGRIGELGVRAGNGLKTQLADLEAQKAQLDASMTKQTALAGGAAPGTLAAPNLKGGASLAAHQGGGDSDIADDGDNTADYSTGASGAGGGDGVSAAKKAQEQITEIAADAAESRKQIAASEYQAQVSVWESEVSQGKITKSQEIQDEIQAQDQMYQAQLAEMQKEAGLLADGTAAKAKALDDIEVLTAQHNADLAKLNADLVDQQVADAKKVADEQQKAAEATAEAWQRAVAPIGNAFDESIDGILQGTQTLQQAELKAAQSIALAYIDAAAKKLVAFVASEAMILARGVATEAGLTGATVAGNAARLASNTSAQATGRAADVALGTAQIAGNAYKAASGAYAAVAGIPYVGPVLAPIAAATAYTAVMAYDVLSAEGGMLVGPNVNPLTQLHENEMVLPSYIAQPLTSALENNNFSSSNSSVGDTNLHYSPTIHGGSGGQDMQAMMKDSSSAMMKQIIDLSRNGTLRLPGR